MVEPVRRIQAITSDEPYSHIVYTGQSRLGAMGRTTLDLRDEASGCREGTDEGYGEVVRGEKVFRRRVRRGFTFRGKLNVLWYEDPADR